MRNSDMDQAVVARTQFENPFAGAELGFALEDVDTLLVRVDVGGYPAASFQRAHRESRVNGGGILPADSPAAESLTLSHPRPPGGAVRVPAPSDHLSPRCSRPT